jgi:D-alanyl-D-alanine carboxypeptidase
MKPVGMKVGYLTEAKINVAVRLEKSNKDRVIVVLHAPNNARRNSEISLLMK